MLLHSEEPHEGVLLGHTDSALKIAEGDTDEERSQVFPCVGEVITPSCNLGFRHRRTLPAAEDRPVQDRRRAAVVIDPNLARCLTCSAFAGAGGGANSGVSTESRATMTRPAYATAHPGPSSGVATFTRHSTSAGPYSPAWTALIIVATGLASAATSQRVPKPTSATRGSSARRLFAVFSGLLSVRTRMRGLGW